MARAGKQDPMSKQLALSAFFSVLAMASLALSTGNSQAPLSSGLSGYAQVSEGLQAPSIPALRLLPR
ncbi:MAG: hypothetical protein H6918_10085 [Sphingomonadaceae bacterium]|nr:hypothetical protein [Sphingomonadaceae bacterium]